MVFSQLFRDKYIRTDRQTSPLRRMKITFVPPQSIACSVIWLKFGCND